MGHTRPAPVAATKALMGDLSRRSVRDTIAEKLAALIASGVLAEGDELPGERELAASLSVSRETVRGAIGILSAHGILRVSHGTRTVVASRDVDALATPGPVPDLGGPHDLDAVHEARLLVERRLAAQAASGADAERLEALAASIRAQEACAGDPVRFLLCDREFHALLYGAGRNAVLADMAMALYNHLLEHRRRIVARPEAVARSIRDHRAILAALTEGDAEAVREAVTVHATRIYETTRQFLADRAGGAR